MGVTLSSTSTAGHWQLPNKTAAKSAAFSRRFDDLPRELKDMIIEDVVVSPGKISIPDFTHARKEFCQPFEYDGDLLEEAHKQFKRVNEFVLPFVEYVLPFNDLTEVGLARNIRHLTINHRIVAEGGDFRRFMPTYKMEAHERVRIDTLPQMFPNLETLTINVDNDITNPSPGPNERPTFMFGGCLMPWLAESEPGNKAWERLFKVHALIDRVRALTFNSYHLNRPVQKKLVFINMRHADPDHLKRTCIDPGAARFPEDVELYIASLYETMDARKMIVLFGEKTV